MELYQPERVTRKSDKLYIRITKHGAITISKGFSKTLKLINGELILIGKQKGEYYIACDDTQALGTFKVREKKQTDCMQFNCTSLVRDIVSDYELRSLDHGSLVLDVERGAHEVEGSRLLWYRILKPVADAAITDLPNASL